MCCLYWLAGGIGYINVVTPTTPTTLKNIMWVVCWYPLLFLMNHLHMKTDIHIPQARRAGKSMMDGLTIMLGVFINLLYTHIQCQTTTIAAPT